MRAVGFVSRWDDEQGWGVLDSPDTPGGCWAHHSAVRTPGYRTLEPASRVVFEAEAAEQDGYAFRAVAVWPDGDEPPAYAAVVPVRVVRAGELVAADPTPGMHRERAFEIPTLWSGRVTTAPGAVSGWHHHHLNQTSLYVVSGILRLEFEGHDGHLDAGAGDFVHVPAFTVHRESNPTDEPSVAVIARAGGGVPTVNVERAPRPSGRSAR